MKAIKLTILVILSYAAIFCRGQGIYLKKLKGSIDNRIISKYDTIFPPINLELFSHSEGMPEGSINDLTQTSDGYVWISVSGYGLVRYDGYHYRSFVPIAGDSNSMPIQFINRIVKSERNGLWLVSNTNLIWFDFKTYKSKIIHNLPTDLLRLTSGWGCIEDKSGQLWVFGRGLYLYNFKTQHFEKINNAVNGITGNSVDITNADYYNIFTPVKLSNDGSIWLDGSFMTHVNPKTKSITCYPLDRNPHGFLPDPDNIHIWTYTSGSIRRYNFKENSWLNITFEDSSTTRLLKNYQFSHIENNKLWISNQKAIIVIDLQTFRIQIYKNENFTSDFRNMLVKGQNSTLWVWNDKNVLFNLSESKRFAYNKILPAGETVCSYWKDENNNIEWFGTVGVYGKGRIYKYNRKSHKLIGFDIPTQPWSPNVLIELNDQELLVGTGDLTKYRKLYRFNRRDFSFKTISEKISNHPTLTTDSLEYLGVCRDSQNNLWLSIYKQGLIKYETNTNKFYYVHQNLKPAITLRDLTLNQTRDGLFYSKDGFIWIGGLGGILNKIDPRTSKVYKLKILQDNDFVIPLCEDLAGNICLTNKTGLALYNIATRKLSKVPGMPYCSKAIIDSNNNIIALSMGLWFYNSKLKASRRFVERDGLEPELLSTLHQLSKSELLINDSYRFLIKSLYPNGEAPPLHLTNIKIAGKDLISTSNVESLNTLTLKHDQNYLSFEFAALSFLPHDANSYACMLQELDTSWQQLGANNAVTYANLTPGSYLFKVKTANRGGVWGKEKTLSIVIVPAFWQTIWFKVLLVLVIASFFYWLYKNQLHQLKLKNQLENEKLQQQQKEVEFEKRLSDLTLSALRSQINPHFIFNCLNSIKLYATQNDINAASEYLTKFSKLLRKVLENSRSKAVPFTDELEVLQLYIEMEAMRFKDKLKYSITVKDVDSDYIEIPPMLIQPYVENAIWHGLMNKEGGGHLEITAAMKNDSALIVTIKDDGIGRAKAAELKSKMASQHKSFGMNITSERLALINQIYKTATSITIDDLMDDKGNAAGTQVTIQIETI